MRWAIVFAAVVMAVPAFAQENPALITELNVEQAEKLIASNADYLKFFSLTSLSPDVAKILAKFDGELYLDHLPTISVEAAVAFSDRDGKLSLAGLTEVT